MNHPKSYFTNKLSNEKSLYLRQHASNPVDWFPWGDEALEKARIEDKLLLISIGYASCRWCHVMARESFENKEIADIMNRHFICIKVDREERPDVDSFYMSAVQLLTGRGGWPLNCIALPDGKPVWGGTYFRPKDWSNILTQIAEIYDKQPEKFRNAAEELIKAIEQSDEIVSGESDKEFSKEIIKTGIDNLKRSLDFENGGTRGVPKFPMPGLISFLTDYSVLANDKVIQDFVELTLAKMAAGGIYDQVGGGFARYSTDSAWFLPHFEKMLYDNAQFISLYSKAFHFYKKPLYRNIVYRTFEFCERDLLAPEGAYYSAKDAETDGEEGLYYVWSKNEIDTLLGENSEFFCSYFNITESGNWEAGKNILFYHSESVLKEHEEDLLKKCLNILLKTRTLRQNLLTDDKILLSWNALMISALCDAFKAFADDSFGKKAVDLTEFFLKENRLKRVYGDHRAEIPPFLDDYANFIKALIDVYEISGEEKYIEKAHELSRETIENFYSEGKELFFYTPRHFSQLSVRQIETSDNVIPSSNAICVENCLRLSNYFHDEKLESIARRAVIKMGENIVQNTGFYYMWALNYVKLCLNIPEYQIVGENADAFIQKLNANFRVDMFVAKCQHESNLPIFKNKFVRGKSLLYVCSNKTCLPPIEKPELIEEIHVKFAPSF